MSSYQELYDSYGEYMRVFLDNEEFFHDFLRVVQGSKNEFSIVKKQCVKSLELDWIETIEKYIPSLDKVIRNPRKFIENREEVLPIEISRNITAESIKHLSQHTNYITSIEGDKITPSKILNVFKEESMDTYENKFVNTLLNRLLIFVTKRCDKLLEAMKDSDYICLHMEQNISLNTDENVNVKFEMRSSCQKSEEDKEQELDISRALKLKSILMEFSNTQFAKEMRNLPFIRPPIMRTNAIMKDVDLRNCLNLWLFIESYTKVGYSVDFIDTNEMPNQSYIDELYGVSAIQYALFKHYTATDQNVVIDKERTKNVIVPHYVKQIYEEFTTDFNITEVEFKKIMNVQRLSLKKKKSEQENLIKNAITNALKIDKELKKLAAARTQPKKKKVSG